MCHLKNVILTLLGSIFGRIYMISMVYCWCCSAISNPAEGEQNKLSAQKSYSYTVGLNFRTYSQTCIKRSPLGQRKSGLIRQVTSKKRFNSYEIFYVRTRKR